MRQKQSQHIDINSVMRESPSLNRLLRMMACRWAGASLATIAGQEGISRQRVHQILTTVGLSGLVRVEPNGQTPATGRGASEKQVAQAIAVLTHRPMQLFGFVEFEGLKGVVDKDGGR